MITITMPKFEELPSLNDRDGIINIYPTLCDNLTKCAQMYHTGASILISDGEYDQMIEFLEQCEATYPDIKIEKSPTELVGFPEAMPIVTLKQAKATGSTMALAKYQHLTPMNSLAKVHTEEELLNWLTKVNKQIEALTTTTSKLSPIERSWVVEGKVDGVAIKLVYADGELIHVVRRGDSHIGDDLIGNIELIKKDQPKLKIRGIPFNLAVSSPDQVFDSGYTTDVIVPPKYLEVIGEFVVTRKDFAEINLLAQTNSSRRYSTPRHAAAGLVEAKSFTYLTFVVHGIGEFEMNGDSSPFISYHDVVDWLQITCGFIPVGYRKIPMLRRNSIADVLDEIKLIKQRKNAHEIVLDGAVIKVDNFNHRTELGSTAKYPKWAIAFKYPSMMSTTVITDIDWQVGRTGVITPVALLEPVTISNVVYSRVTLNNPDSIIALDLRRHDVVYVQRAGDVIPKIVGVVEERRADRAHKFKIPTVCGDCGADVEISGKRLFCTNRNCVGRSLSILVYSVSKPVLNIAAIAIKTLKALYKCGLVTRPEHLFQLTDENLKERFRSTENKRLAILTAIDEVRKKLTVQQVLLCLSIPNLSKVAVDEIAWRYPTIDKLLSLVADNELNQDPAEISAQVKKTAYWKSMISYFQSPEIVESLYAFKEVMNRPA